jgi:hypothetical protein
MRLQELFETTEEDRALVSLSSSIYAKLQDYFVTEPDYTDEEQEIVSLGKIGDLFDTPIEILNNVSLELQGGEPFIERSKESNGKKHEGIVLAMWDDPTKTIVLNLDYLDADRMRTTITHELRHALDEYKSRSFPGNAKRYFTPKKKEHRKEDPYSTAQYRAQPAEINARFIEVLDLLSTSIIPRALKLSPDQSRPKIMHDLNHLLLKYEIADLFPERTQSPDYKRLIKRAVDFIDKEMAYRTK